MQHNKKCNYGLLRSRQDTSMDEGLNNNELYQSGNMKIYPADAQNRTVQYQLFNISVKMNQII